MTIRQIKKISRAGIIGVLFLGFGIKGLFGLNVLEGTQTENFLATTLLENVPGISNNEIAIKLSDEGIAGKEEGEMIAKEEAYDILIGNPNASFVVTITDSEGVMQTLSAEQIHFHAGSVIMIVELDKQICTSEKHVLNGTISNPDNNSVTFFNQEFTCEY